MEKQDFIDHKKKKRPDFLVLLCILTFIGSGLQAFSHLFMLFNKDYALTHLNETAFNIEDFHPIFEMPSVFFLLNATFFIISLSGAFLMWNLKKIGFHVYSLAQISILFVLSIYNPFQSVPIYELLITSLFIFLYYRQLKYMS